MSNRTGSEATHSSLSHQEWVLLFDFTFLRWTLWGRCVHFLYYVSSLCSRENYREHAAQLHHVQSERNSPVNSETESVHIGWLDTISGTSKSNNVFTCHGKFIKTFHSYNINEDRLRLNYLNKFVRFSPDSSSYNGRNCNGGSRTRSAGSLGQTHSQLQHTDCDSCSALNSR